MGKIEDLKDLLEIQGRDGNWNHDDYMFGMYNGMELALAIIEGRDPDYRERPEEWRLGARIKESLTTAST